MKGNTFVGLLAAVVFTTVGAMVAWATTDPLCVGKNAGQECRAATACSDAVLCIGSPTNLQCPNGPVNPNNYNGDPCNFDKNVCTVGVCGGGKCDETTPLNCDDGDACTVDGCDQFAGCQHTPVNCPGGTACQVATCDPINGCGLDSTGCVTDTCGTAVPVISCPSDQTVECVNGAGQNTLGNATTTCAADEITNNGAESYDFVCSGSNSHEVTYTATSDGGSSSCTATLTVEDTGKPTATCGASVTVKTSEQGGTCSASLTPSASGTDACEGALTGTCDPDELTLSGPGTAPANCIVEDCSDNSDSCTQSLTLVDDTPPTITCAAPYVTPPLAPMSWTASAITDNCVGATTTNVTSVDCYMINGSGKLVSKLAACKASYSGNTVSVGPSAGGVGTIIKWTVSSKDASGNTSTATCMTQVQNPGLTKP